MWIYASQRMSRPFIFLCEKLPIPATKILKDLEMPFLAFLITNAIRSRVTYFQCFSLSLVLVFISHSEIYKGLLNTSGSTGLFNRTCRLAVRCNCAKVCYAAL